MRTAIIISMALIALSSNPLFTQHENSRASAAPIAAPAATTPLHMPASARTQNGSQQTQVIGVSGRPLAADLPAAVSAAH
ncbi:MAG TPA: hypothetical protein VK764_01450 [Terracidiphilus sp.]|jgi:hypothetical protein|nr:hypothetical protein [Terracidiphilus sp.]